MSVFGGLRKKLSDKEFKAMWDAIEKAEQERTAWGKAVVEFLNSGKMPPKSSADIEKIISEAEKLALENQKKLKKNDSRAADMKQLIKDIQDTKIDHRKTVGNELARFEGLDSSGAGVVSKAAKDATKIVDDTKTVVGDVLSKLRQKAELGRKGAFTHILKNAGYVKSQQDQSQKMSKLMGRTVKSSIDFGEFKTAHDRVNELERLVQALEQAEKMIKKL